MVWQQETSSYAKMTHLNMMLIRYEIGELYSVRLAKEALYAKRNFERIRKEWSYIDKVAFCMQAPLYIAYNNLMSVFHL